MIILTSKIPMDNDEIKIMFDKLQTFVEKNIDAGKKEHDEIKAWLRKLCDRMTSTENIVDNHLESTAQKVKTKKEKTHLIITGVSLLIAGIAVITSFF